MSRLVFLAMLVVAALAAQKCWEIPSEKQFVEMETCKDIPKKSCGSDAEGASAPDFSKKKSQDETYAFLSNWSRFNWENDGYRDCQARVSLCKDFTYKQKVDEAESFCRARDDDGNRICDQELESVCKKIVLDNWSGYCANEQGGPITDGCAKANKYLEEKPYCDMIATAYKDGGLTCTDDAECNLLPCYKDNCLDWCSTAKTCYYKVEQKVMAAKDADCRKSYMAPWNAASTVVPSVLALVAVLLAL